MGHSAFSKKSRTTHSAFDRSMSISPSVGTFRKEYRSSTTIPR
jgi:hypothetical protein